MLRLASGHATEALGLERRLEGHLVLRRREPLRTRYDLKDADIVERINQGRDDAPQPEQHSGRRARRASAPAATIVKSRPCGPSSHTPGV